MPGLTDYPGWMNAQHAGDAWTDEEVEATVEKYFDMMAWENKGERFVKVQIYRELAARFGTRTVKSIERKMCNISAVMSELGYSFLTGLSPLGHYQRHLGEAVRCELKRRESGEENFQEIFLSVSRRE